MSPWQSYSSNDPSMYGCKLDRTLILKYVAEMFLYQATPSVTSGNPDSIPLTSRLLGNTCIDLKQGFVISKWKVEEMTWDIGHLNYKPWRTNV